MFFVFCFGLEETFEKDARSSQKKKNQKTKNRKQVGYLTQCDAGLGRRVAQKLQSMGAA